jgi:hypothetical protein
MSFDNQFPSLQHATISASVKWLIAAHRRREFFRDRPEAAGS